MFCEEYIVFVSLHYGKVAENILYFELLLQNNNTLFCRTIVVSA